MTGSPHPDRILPRLHVVTDDAVLSRADFERAALHVLEQGGSRVALHLRGPRKDGAELFRLASSIRPHAERFGAALFVNDRVDVALAGGLDGVHVGRRSLSVSAARALLGSEKWLGVSVRDAGEALAARGEGADYAFLGTIFDTPSHPERRGMGIEALLATTRRVESFRLVAIGGIDPARVADVTGGGAYGVAVVRGIWGARDPAAAVERYLHELHNARGVLAPR